METKSRYEVISDLERQRRQLIQDKNSLDDQTKAHQRGIKELKRQLEDREEALKEFQETLDDKRKVADELIASVDEALKRFDRIGDLQSQKK